MTNVFRKLIRKEFGEECYNQYFDCFRKNIEKKVSDSKEIYEDISKRLEEKDKQSLDKMQRRLNDTLIYAVRINKTYFLLFIVYLFASIYLIIQNLNPAVTIGALLLLSVCFVSKTYEYILNKYCYIDARIILIYKTVLEKQLEQSNFAS